ncbi:hypothetical protein [Streptomyces sp. T028]|uniref:hypothetical protein n=1 Tax=Streptomyces sp. T028 TaxID=3394379 RepID=UPI003A84CA3A
MLGLVLGLAISCDLGGAVYKIAFGYALAGVDTYTPTPDHLTFMATVLAAAMAPSLGMSLATLARRRLFTESERQYGKVAWLLSMAASPQGAVPFALRDPLRVIPACMAGGSVAGVLVMTFGSTMAVPYGGFLASDKLGKPLLMVAAVAAGALVTALVTVALKSIGHAEAPAKSASTVRARTKAAVAG